MKNHAFYFSMVPIFATAAPKVIMIRGHSQYRIVLSVSVKVAVEKKNESGGNP
jgi:hypothetical protein